MANRAYMAISNISGIGIRTLVKIPYEVISSLKDAQDIHAYICSESFPLKRKNIQEISLEDVRVALRKADETIKRNESYNVSLISIYDSSYPKQFRRLENFPPFIFAKGNIRCLKDDSIAVIGTRNPSETGRKWGTRLSELLASNGFNIVSGLAVGSDTCGHRGAINAGGKTIAVLPCSLDQVYPPSNQKLLEEILACGGCAVSEYPIGSVINKSNFVERDRLQSGLAMGVAVIETGVKGGTWNAVNVAFKMNIPVGFLDFGDEHYKKYECSYGNKVGILEKGAIALRDSASIDIFIAKCRNSTNKERLGSIVQESNQYSLF